MAKRKKRVKAKASGKKRAEKGIAGEIRKYPGLSFAAVFSVIVVALFIVLSLSTAINIRSEMAEDLSLEIRSVLSSFIADIDSELDGEYEYALEDDQLLSMKSEFEWLREKEREAYNSFPLGDAEAREAALFLFIDNVLYIDEVTSYAFGETDYGKTISDALESEFEAPDIISQDLDQLNFGEADLQKIRLHFNSLFNEYIAEKKFALKTFQSEERKFVEAKKILYIRYMRPE